MYGELSNKTDYSDLVAHTFGSTMLGKTNLLWRYWVRNDLVTVIRLVWFDSGIESKYENSTTWLSIDF